MFASVAPLKKDSSLKLETVDSILEFTQIQFYLRTLLFEYQTGPNLYCGKDSTPIATKEIPNTKYSWEITAIVDREDINRFLTLARNTCNLFLSDFCKSVVESTITRAKANHSISVQKDNLIEYFGKFLVKIDQDSVQIEHESSEKAVRLSFIVNENNLVSKQ